MRIVSSLKIKIIISVSAILAMNHRPRHVEQHDINGHMPVSLNQLIIPEM